MEDEEVDGKRRRENKFLPKKEERKRYVIFL
jgi:hypothetical protein